MFSFAISFIVLAVFLNPAYIAPNPKAFFRVLILDVALFTLSFNLLFLVEFIVLFNDDFKVFKEPTNVVIADTASFTCTSILFSIVPTS